MTAPRILVVDNYDSFTYNLVHAFAGAGAHVTVHRNDAVDRDAIARDAPDGIVLSPGPGHPGQERDFGVCKDLITEPWDGPLLGVCLGMQGMALHSGGAVVPAPAIVHGSASRFRRGDHAVFAGLPPELSVGRYHSLAVDAERLPPDWQALGATEDGTLMAMAHRRRPWVGVQFHPESILTPDGPKMVHNFLEMCR